ncbi:hypothetical protein [Vibrio sp. Evd11]|uniref:hypothetical protein n=1 Tax=Vibrio sp. Evd11 TaxID=1207404 RepID=UPI0013C4C40E|nr:hypothetical protein [Vibrio sp. Evd11]
MEQQTAMWGLSVILILMGGVSSIIALNSSSSPFKRIANAFCAVIFFLAAGGLWGAF